MIGNVERIPNLFLSKTVYSALLALIIGAIGVAATFLEFDPVPFPFLPRHVMISAWFTIGIPAFILSLAPTNERARSGFVSRVLRLAIPSGMVVTLMTLGVYLILSVGGFTAATHAEASTAALLTLIIVMLHVLSIVCRPYENWKLLLLAACVLGYVGLFGLPWTRNLLALDVTNWSATGFGVAMGLIGAILVEAISHRLRRSTEPAR